MYALIDCNNFYASCERVFQPQFNGKPIAILSNNDGCIISRSDEAKKLGIPMGVPEFKVRALLKEHQVQVFSSNYSLYGDLSHRVMKILEEFTPCVEVYSIDEAFMNFDGMQIANYQEYGFQIRNRIKKWTSIPTSIGFAPSKALSKVANKIARKFPEHTNGVYVIDTDEKRIKALKWTKIEDIWGIGFRLSKKMKAKNILTAYDFIQPYHEAFIKKEMGVTGLRLKYELEGKSVIDIEEPKNKKSIAITRSFEKNITDYNELKERVSTFSMVCAEKLRKQKSCCYNVIIYLRKDKYIEENARYNFSRMYTLPFATNSGITISTTAIKMLNEIFEENTIYKKAGVIVTQIIPEETKQFHLFEEENPKHQAIMKVMDDFLVKTGERKIKLGNQDLEKTWKMKQNHLSRKYTTDIKEILTVKC
ncbi:SOS mutagenesis and repair protein UmuC [Flavobacterium sp. 9AF]|uniref:Y-family DNA polymerase n=1 Tax=Flavobacterium sp. 9AF TaxID=2653142 RepID=UPI0012F3D38D|nr:Y-family DNA polymerase [Flavobacterium sp. 9AF]VXB20599.1 SOS mutagenesis and repair protein UmuC [Flavobacterium sp. 9AF]